MRNRCTVGIFTIFLSAFVIPVSYAADSLARTYPAAVLVELKTEQSRLNALIKDKKYQELEEAKKDVNAVNAVMVLDFKDHFTYCPVYYFVDTNEHLILKKHFDGILLNADMQPARNMVINAADKDYVIVYYGYPTEQPHNEKAVKDAAKYTNNSGEPMGKGLIIDNDKMQQITYLYNMGYDAVALNKKDRKYAYSSRHFNIDYFPSAQDFNKKLAHRKNMHRIKFPRRMGS